MALQAVDRRNIKKGWVMPSISLLVVISIIIANVIHLFGSGSFIDPYLQHVVLAMGWI